jgi:hypothetical protein
MPLEILNNFGKIKVIKIKNYSVEILQQTETDTTSSITSV